MQSYEIRRTSSSEANLFWRPHNILVTGDCPRVAASMRQAPVFRE